MRAAAGTGLSIMLRRIGAVFPHPSALWAATVVYGAIAPGNRLYYALRACPGGEGFLLGAVFL